MSDKSIPFCCCIASFSFGRETCSVNPRQLLLNSTCYGLDFVVYDQEILFLLAGEDTRCGVTY
jgi:hypothetical protein